jgi:hypothetical protein
MGNVRFPPGPARAALFRYEIRYGSDPDLKKFAQSTLPKIDDHLQRSRKIEGITAIEAS